MSNKCDKFSDCTFLTAFNGISEAEKYACMQRYCLDIKKSEHCFRKQFIARTNRMPIPNMTPYGSMIFKAKNSDRVE